MVTTTFRVVTRKYIPRTLREHEIHGNRMLLREMLEYAGFTPYEREWWHFDLSAD